MADANGSETAPVAQAKPRRRGNPANLRPWKPGESGNVHGRPKASMEQLAEAHRLAACATPDAVRYWLGVLADEKASEAARNKAAENIADRGGLVRGFVLADGGAGPLADATPTERLAVYAKILEQLRSEASSGGGPPALPSALPDVIAAPDKPSP